MYVWCYGKRYLQMTYLPTYLLTMLFKYDSSILISKYKKNILKLSLRYKIRYSDVVRDYRFIDLKKDWNTRTDKWMYRRGEVIFETTTISENVGAGLRIRSCSGYSSMSFYFSLPLTTYLNQPSTKNLKFKNYVLYRLTCFRPTVFEVRSSILPCGKGEGRNTSYPVSTGLFGKIVPETRPPLLSFHVPLNLK